MLKKIITIVLLFFYGISYSQAPEKVKEWNGVNRLGGSLELKSTALFKVGGVLLFTLSAITMESIDKMIDKIDDDKK